MTIYCLIGTPAAGKTTLAETMVRYMNAVIISRDKLREMLYGYKPENMKAYWDREDVNDLEKGVNGFQDALIKQTLKAGKDIILDNTHLRLKYINDLKKYNQPLKFILVETDYETALERDAARVRSVGSDVLLKMFQELEHLKKTFDFKDWTPPVVEPIVSDDTKPHAFVFDLDGTLALNNGKRSPYDWKRVGEDDVNLPVKTVLNALSGYGWHIILCSGRDGVCKPETQEWLDKHEIDYDRLFMREKGDQRKDYIIKEELWREISEHYHIVAMFDDRNQVVDHGRKLGFPVFQVQEGDF